MDVIGVKCDETVLIVSEQSAQLDTSSFDTFTNKILATRDELSALQENINAAVFLQLPEEQITDTLLKQLLKLLKPGGKLVIQQALKDVDKIEFVLKTGGYTQLELKHNKINPYVLALKPQYEVGSSTKLNLKKPTAVWKLDDDLDEEVETIDPDNLLDDDDFAKPEPGSLRVCGTTGKRKACRDCSCGLADELAAETQAGKIIDTTNAPKSSCGSCYLGDAFRCATCPYLGMPAFKPGEKIQLNDNLLKADI